MKSKQELRAELKAKRDSLRESEAKRASIKILNKLREGLDWQNIHSLNMYMSVRVWKEVDTWSLLQYIWHEWPNIQTSTMRMNNDGTMQTVVIDQSTDWVMHDWGVLEPRKGKVLPKNHQFDVIIVPVLGFDSQNNRLGLGKGCYDRFLKNQSKVHKIGLAYSWAKLEAFPYEPHDIKLDQVITNN